MPASRTFALRAAQALTHRGRAHDEGPRDAGRVESQHRLQHERGARGRIDGGMRANKQELETVVRETCGVGRHLLGHLRGSEQRGRPVVAHASVAFLINQPAPRHRQEPGFGFARHPSQRPRLESVAKRFCERVLRLGHVP